MRPEWIASLVSEKLSLHMESVARHILGEPNTMLSSKRELRYGTNGSLSVNLEKGTWYDHENQIGGGVLAFIEQELKLANGTAINWLHENLGISLPRNANQPVAAYDYSDETGNQLYQVVRFEPKDFRQRRPDGAGGWIWKLDGVRQVPFHLPQLLAANDRTIHIVEGEKDVFALERLGLVATTNAGGAGKWSRDFASFFNGADVVILPDNDQAGEEHAKKVADLLASSASRIRIVRLPGLPPKGDVSNWIANGGTAEKLAALCQDQKPSDPRIERLAALNLISASTLLATTYREPTWSVPDLVPEGLGLLAGKPKTGKSWLALDFGIAVASGGYALGNIPCKQGDVLYLALEDTQRRLNGRVKAVLQGKPAPEALSIATEWKRADDGGLDDIEMWLQLHPNARLVLIDTLQKVRGARKRDAGVYEDDYRAIAEYKKLSDKYTVPFLMVHHLNKMGNDDPLMAVSGTAGITGSADTILVLSREPNDPNAVLYVRGRDVNEAEVAIQFDNETGKWLKLGKAQDWRISEERRAIIKLLIEEGPMHPKEIAHILGKPAGSIRVTLHRMCKDTEITKLQDGRYSP